MLKIGLTGGLGSGKSTVACIFEVLGIPVYYADEAAKRLMVENNPLKTAIIQSFGTGAYIGGQLNRSYLAGIVFNNPGKLQLLNSLVHPAVIKDAGDWFIKQKGPYIIKEAALLFESGSNEELDYVVGVAAPEHLRIQRTMKRDRISEDEVLARMNQQMDDSSKLGLCDFIINNDEEHMVIPQVLTLHEKFLELS